MIKNLAFPKKRSGDLQVLCNNLFCLGWGSGHTGSLCGADNARKTKPVDWNRVFLSHVISRPGFMG